MNTFDFIHDLPEHFFASYWVSRAYEMTGELNDNFRKILLEIMYAFTRETQSTESRLQGQKLYNPLEVPCSLD